jgi:hypothetical protein
MHWLSKIVLEPDRMVESQTLLHSVREHGGLLMKLLAQSLPITPKVIAARSKFGWKSPSERKKQADAMRRQKARGLRRDCIAGLRILMYVAMADGVVTTEEANVVASYLEARLAMLKVEHDPQVSGYLLDSAAMLTVTPRSLQVAVSAVAKDREYFTLVMECALVLVEVDGDFSALARHVMKSLMAAGTAAGWLASDAQAEAATARPAALRT